MNRLTGLALALTLVGVGRSAHAQVPTSTYGGFGYEYTQTVPSNTYVLNGLWMTQPTSMASTTLPPRVVVQPSGTVQAVNARRTARTARLGRPFSRVAGRGYGPVAAQPTAPLPTGSLYWPAASGVPIYSPPQRYINYGWGYGVSPFGRADYGPQYYGLPWGY